MRHLVPDAEIAFGHGVGFTDSNWFHAAYPETVAYGFNPHLVDSHDDVIRRCHGKDERIRVREFALQALHAERVARGPLSRRDRSGRGYSLPEASAAVARRSTTRRA